MLITCNDNDDISSLQLHLPLAREHFLNSLQQVACKHIDLSDDQFDLAMAIGGEIAVLFFNWCQDNTTDFNFAGPAQLYLQLCD